MGKGHFNKKNIFLLLQLLFLGLLCVFALVKKSGFRQIPLELSDFSSESAVYDGDNDSWSINTGEDKNAFNESITLLKGPGIHLDRGSYTLHLEYSSDKTQMGKVSVIGGDEAVYGKGKNAYIEAEEFRLSGNAGFVDYDFKAREAVDGFQLEISYSGDGAFTLSRAHLQPNLLGFKKNFVLILLVFLLADSYVFAGEWLRRRKRTIFYLGGILLLASLPLLAGGTMLGKDFPYHIMRLESVAEELKRGVFPVFLNSSFYDGNGYPSSIYYNDIFMYIPALSRLLGFTVSEAMAIYIFMMNTLTVLISYLCFKRIFRDRSAGLICSLAYSLAPYRILCIYVRSAVGEYSAMSFLPLLLLSLWLIYDETDSYSVTEAAMYMGLGMSGLIATHILTVMMACWVMLAMVLIFIKKLFSLKVIKTYALAVAGTVLLNLYYVVPLLDYYINVDCNINHQVSGDNVLRIQQMGTSIAYYFAVFKDMFSAQSVHVSQSMQKSPGLILMAALFFGILLWVHDCLDRKGKFITCVSLGFLFLASDVFPWDSLSCRFGIANLISQVQFPWRYISMAVLFLTLLLGYMCQRYPLLPAAGIVKREIVYILIGSVAVLMSLYSLSNLIDDSNIKNIRDTAELRTNYVGGAKQYVRFGTQVEELGYYFDSEGIEGLQLTADEGTRVELTCEGCGNESWIELPRQNYRGYSALLSDGSRIYPVDGSNNRVRFLMPAGYSGSVTVDYRPPFYWYLAWIFSALLALALAVYKGCEITHRL